MTTIGGITINDEIIEAPTAGPPYFVDDRHALYCGWVIAIAMRNGFPVDVEADEDGNYTGQIVLTLPRISNRVAYWEDGVKVTISVPYPPDDWTFG